MQIPDNIVGFAAEAVVTCFLAILGYNVRSAKKDIDECRIKIHQLETNLPATYISKHDFESFTERLFQKLDRIDDKLDTKVDK